ncbi:MAG TPA: LysR family transcriptional regulator [Rubrivivax sp.]|nr:LysR family transcriptional regulator [Rubrivivax sp.]
MKSTAAISDKLDLNLLRVLVALASTRNVNRAAELLGMSQSGFSSAVARLRRHFADEMFIRAAGTMQPTALAQRLSVSAKDVLARIDEEILRKPVFDAATSTTQFRLAMSDVAEAIYLPTLLRQFAVEAPHVAVTTDMPPIERLQGGMASGEVDLAMGYFPDLDTQQFFRQKLYTHTYACIAREGHPVGRVLTPTAFERCGHAVPATPARSTELLERFFARQRISRHVVLRTPHYLALSDVVANTDLIATVPLAVAARFSGLGGVRVLALPFDPPRFDVQQYWHRAVHKDPRSQWLRARLHGLFGGASAAWADVEAKLYGRRKALAKRPR